MDEEMKALHNNEMWELVDLPPGRKADGNNFEANYYKRFSFTCTSIKFRVGAI